MTDKEIMKALECCVNDDEGVLGFCNNGCPLFGKNANCPEVLRKNALDLINRQKAENEELQKERIERIRELTRAVYDEEFSKAKAEALKKFAEKLKQRQHLDKDNNAVISVLDVNEVLKEMGEKNEY